MSKETESSEENEKQPEGDAGGAAKPALPSTMASYLSLFERLLDPTFLLDYDSFIIREVNDSCEKVFGFPTADFVGKQLTTWVCDEDAVSCEKMLRMARRRYYPFQVDLKMKTQGGTVIVVQAAACALGLTDHSQVIQILVKDITKQHEAEEKAARYLKDLQEANEKLATQSITDEMTQLSNFRFFKTQLAMQHERSTRFPSPYSIVFFDLDNFKHYNDQNGHPAGDELLRGVAKILKASCRVSDLPARYGGEEFVILCAGVNAHQARVLAERVRVGIESTDFPHAKNQPLGVVSTSVGIASFPENGATAESILIAADQALYVSKKSGRNRTTISTVTRDVLPPTEKIG